MAFKRVAGESDSYFSVGDYADLLRSMSRRGDLKDISINRDNYRTVASAIVRALSKSFGKFDMVRFRGICIIKKKKRRGKGIKTGLFAGLKGKKTYVSCEFNPHFIRRLNGEM